MYVVDDQLDGSITIYQAREVQESDIISYNTLVLWYTMYENERDPAIVGKKKKERPSLSGRLKTREAMLKLAIKNMP